MRILNNLECIIRMILFLTVFEYDIGYSHHKLYPSRSIEQLTAPVNHAEGPHWDSKRNVLFFVDITSKRIYCYDPASKKTTFAVVDGEVGVIVPLKNTKDKFVCGIERNLSVVTWNFRENCTRPLISTLDQVEPTKSGNRFNDGKADITGRLWIGTMGPENEKTGAIPPGRGSLYKTASRSCKLEKMMGNLTISNGITWSVDNKYMYLIDSGNKHIMKMDFDLREGKISNKRVFVDFERDKINGIPDGMTMDHIGNLWVACYNGSQIVNIDGRTGKFIRSISLPAERVTSVTIGDGIEKGTLFVTTSRRGLTQNQLSTQPSAGAVFAIKNIYQLEGEIIKSAHQDVTVDCLLTCMG